MFILSDGRIFWSKMKTAWAGWPESAICPKSCYFYKPCATKNEVLVAQQKVLFWKSQSCNFATFEPKGCYCCYFWIKCQNQAKNQCNFKVFKCVNLQILPCGAFVVFYLQYKHSGLHLNLPSVNWFWLCVLFEKNLGCSYGFKETHSGIQLIKVLQTLLL